MRANFLAEFLSTAEAEEVLREQRLRDVQTLPIVGYRENCHTRSLDLSHIGSHNKKWCVRGDGVLIGDFVG
ncbi:hypothetical protein [Anabaena catenula]|uniref:hypothetical protein n=1 Tax=Anabaena catenula TaxID=1296320 RepID=UPI001F54B25E|nr:hypothetical protein [Anabaena catenula]